MPLLGFAALSWPQLLHLYSRLKPGITIHEWIEENDLTSHGVDVRRFLSFGVIKGFLRRVHRWPVLLSQERPAGKRRKAGMLGRVISSERIDALFGAVAGTGIGVPVQPPSWDTSVSASLESTSSVVTVQAGKYPNFQPKWPQPYTLGRTGSVTQPGQYTIPFSPTSTAPMQMQQSVFPNGRPRQRQGSVHSVINTQHASHPYLASTAAITASSGVGGNSEPHSLGNNYNSFFAQSREASGSGGGISGSWKSAMGPPTPTLTRNRSRTASMSRVSITGTGGGGATLAGVHATGTGQPLKLYPDGLPALLDGKHHTDELCTKYGVGWKELEEYLVEVGKEFSNESEDGHLGRVRIILR